MRFLPNGCEDLLEVEPPLAPHPVGWDPAGGLLAADGIIRNLQDLSQLVHRQERHRLLHRGTGGFAGRAL
jgi:hypothetical protein